MAAFTQNLLWLSTRIVSEEDCDCLRFIASPILGINQQHKNPKEILEQLEEANLLSENNIHIVYEALTLMKQIKLRNKFLKKIGYQQYEPKPSVISAFTRMLISVRRTLGCKELSYLVYSYKKDKGAGVIEYQNRAYAVLLYLMDKLLLTNDVESLNKFAVVLKTATSIRGQTSVERYLKENPNLPERAGSESTQDCLSTSTVDFTQEDSDKINEAGIQMQNEQMSVGDDEIDATEANRVVISNSTIGNLVVGSRSKKLHMSSTLPSSTPRQVQDDYSGSTENTGQDHGEQTLDHGEHALPRDRDSTDLGYSSPIPSPEIDATEANRGNNVNSSAANLEPTSGRMWLLMYWLIPCGVAAISVAFLFIYDYSNSLNSVEKKVYVALFICLIFLFVIGVIYNVVYFDSLSDTQKRSSIFAAIVISIMVLVALNDLNANLSKLESLSYIKKGAFFCIIIIFFLILFHVISNIERILKPLLDILFTLWR